MKLIEVLDEENAFNVADVSLFEFSALYEINFFFSGKNLWLYPNKISPLHAC